MRVSGQGRGLYLEPAGNGYGLYYQPAGYRYGLHLVFAGNQTCHDQNRWFSFCQEFNQLSLANMTHWAVRLFPELNQHIQEKNDAKSIEEAKKNNGHLSPPGAGAMNCAPRSCALQNASCNFPG